MTPEAAELATKMCGRPIRSVGDLTPVETEAILNDWAKVTYSWIGLAKAHTTPPRHDPEMER